MDHSQDNSTVNSEWELEFARLVAFPLRSHLVEDQHWWEELVAGQPAEHEPKWPHQRFTRDDLNDDRGSFRGVLLALTVARDSIAWEVRSEEIGADDAGRFPTLPAYQEKLKWFVGLLGPWLSGPCPPIRRLAFHAKLLRLVANAKRAYETLEYFLPGVELLKTDPRDLNDFLLQVNRRTSSKVVQINQVSTWYKMNLGLEIKPGFKWPAECYCALELHINTAPEHLDPLPKESLADLFEELVSLAVPIADGGIGAMKGMAHA